MTILKFFLVLLFYTFLKTSTAAAINDKLPEIKSKRGSIAENIGKTSSMANDESFSDPPRQATNSQIRNALAILPSLFSSKTKQSSTKYESTSCNNLKEESRNDKKVKKPIKLFKILSCNSESFNVQEQVKIATEELIKYMNMNSESLKSDYDHEHEDNEQVNHFINHRINHNDNHLINHHIIQQDSQQYNQLLDLFPKKSVPLDLILKTLNKIWAKVQTFHHRTIFDEISIWAISIVERDFPTDFWIFLDQIIFNKFQYSTYQLAVKKAANLLSYEQVKSIIERLKSQLLEPTEEGEYKFYGKFNIHFIELASNYPNFYSLELPSKTILTPTLTFIYKSTEILKVFNTNLIDPVDVIMTLNNLMETCIINELSPLMFTEQLEIIINLNREAFDSLDSLDKTIITNAIVETIGHYARTIGLYPEISDKAAYALIIQGNFNDLLTLLIKNLNPLFTVNEFGFLLNLADNLNPDKPDGTLLTLLASITIPRAAWSCSDAFSERSLRLHMYIETILSIQDQNISFDHDLICTPIKILGKSKVIEWKIPRAIDRNNYEMITTADMLVIPCLFIQRVLHRDYRKSRVIQRYLRSGKPNYRQFPKIINEILEEQCLGIDYQFPILEIIPVFPRDQERERLHKNG